ncbi:type III effector HopX1 [Xanthomonas translucens]|uniref:type III effector HopX1 n=1 Tax=Xanthomonas campestris pv. translucens TaxID=343 RepID=UPI001F247801|nr:type III effector HopX1 [Xanthomonas translucens]UKE50918.1 type III effector HopX1 [Xanthomonas translucens]UNU11076.1 type III effector HopX1 [Xanthomonas translucens pv. translucens]
MFPKLSGGAPSVAPAAAPAPTQQASTQHGDRDARPADAAGSGLPDGLRRSRPNRTSPASASPSAASSAALGSNDLALAAYLLARDIDGRGVPTPEVDRLRKANESVGNTRQLLEFGRGNVATDLRETGNHSCLRTKAARQLKNELDMRGGGQFVEYVEQMAHSAAAATVFGSGNCGEYTSITSIRHSSKLQAQETVHRVINTNHVWAEARVPADDGSGANTIVMDAWAKGPAVLAPDSRFAARREEVQSTVQLDPVTGRTARIAANDLILEMRAKGPAEVERRIRQGATCTERVAAGINHALLPLGIGGYWPEQHVLNDAFAERVRARLASPVSADLLARAERIAAAFGVAGTERKAQAQQIIAATHALVALR